jgi:ribosomal protein L7/L12
MPIGPLNPRAGASEQFASEIRALLSEGRKIEAIKRVRERTGIGLKEAKDAVEAMGEREPRSTTLAEREPRSTTLADLEPELIAFLEQGRKIEAIKRVRDRSEMGLKQAKDLVDQLALHHPVRRRCPECATLLASGEFSCPTCGLALAGAGSRWAWIIAGAAGAAALALGILYATGGLR